MRSILQVVAIILTFTTPALAICPSFHRFQNGDTANGNDVMDNFDYILNCPYFGGNVGIGTGTPVNPLQVNLPAGAGTPYVAVNQVGGNPYIEMQRWTGFSGLYEAARIKLMNGSGGQFAIETTGGGGAAIGSQIFAERMRIVGGNIGIGTTSPNYPLEVNGTGYATSWQQSSDRRLKEDIKPIAFDALAKVMALHPVTFRWKAPKDDGMRGVQMGLIAQEVEQVIPTAVLTSHNASKTKGLKYNELTAVLIKAVQEQQAMIEKQAKSIRVLDKKNTDLEARLKRMEHNRVASLH